MKKSILLIDDEPLFCRSLIPLLEAKGFQADSVHTGREGLWILEKTHYHGVILDLGLPDIEGEKIAEQIVKQYPDVAILILTGMNDAENGLALLRMGVFDYLVKPCDPDHLVRILCRAIQQKQSKRTLRDSYEIINRSPAIAFLWCKEEGLPVEFVSENVFTLCGHSANEFVSGQIAYVDIIHPGDVDRVRAEVRQCGQSSEQCSFQHEPYRIVTRDSQVKWVEHNTYVKRNSHGEISHYQGIVLDISQRKEEEEILQRSKRHWERTFDAIPALITLQDKEMRIMRANKATADFFQASYGEILGKHCYQLFENKEQPCADCPTLDTLAKACSHTRPIEYKQWNKVFQVTSSPVVDGSGEVTHLVHTARDITEQKKLEQHLLHAHKMEAIGTLAGGIAHDFNNLLTVVLGSAEVVKYNMQSGMNPSDNLEQIITAGKRASQLVKQLLSFSRKSEHKLQPFEAYLIVKEALKMLRSSFPATIEIQVAIERQSGVILADPTRIYQVVVELCTNALHAMEKEKGVLGIRLRRQHLDPEDIPEQEVEAGSFVVLSVSDTGSGMDRATLERVFDPYYTTKEVGRGSGLGLAVIHGIIRDYKGMVRVESSPGGGTVVHVYIPALEVESKTSATGNKEEQLVGSEHVLVVDDESSIVSIQKVTLENLGYKVTVTTDSEEAWAMLAQQPEAFDVLVTDQTMPHMTGVELATKVLELRPDFPIILCTGYSALVSEQDVLAIGVRRFLPKPVVGNELGLAVRGALDQPAH